MVYSTRRFVLCLTLCYFVLVFFSPFSIAITSLGEERANLSAFRTFVRFALVWFCLFPLPLGVWEGLRFVIVALPGLFSYLLFYSLLLVVYSTRRFVLCLTLCYFVLVFFRPFSIAITSLGEERANLSAYRTFVRFVLVCFCLFPLPLGVWGGLRFVNVALPGFFSYIFYSLLLCGLFYEANCFMSYIVLFCSCVFQAF